MTPIQLAAALRRSMMAMPSIAAQESLAPPPHGSVYVPRQHPKALSADRSVVVGMRGAGKSLWTAVLANPEWRGWLGRVGESDLASIDARVGFGMAYANQDFPGPDVFANMLERGSSALEIWWAVVVRHAAAAGGLAVDPRGDWTEWTRWVAADAERRDALLARADEALAQSNRTLVVLFDALDRLADQWDRVKTGTRAALQVCLRLRSLRAIRGKVFLRPDLEEDPEIWAFADSSKLRQGIVRLDWSAADLYGLLVTRLLNGDAAGRMEDLVAHIADAPVVRTDGFALYPARHLDDPERQYDLMERLASPFMGPDRRRGYTSSWVPLHLADANGRVTPRSWLLAFQRAAVWTEENKPDFARALHYDGIKHGVIQASLTRVDEIVEDYPWTRPLLEAARGMTVPVTRKELAKVWHDVRPVGGDRLPPRRWTTDPVRRGQIDALIDDMVELAVVYRTRDGRVNIPDIFRVGFGIGRKGGVRPPT